MKWLRIIFEAPLRYIRYCNALATKPLDPVECGCGTGCPDCESSHWV